MVTTILEILTQLTFKGAFHTANMTSKCPLYVLLQIAETLNVLFYRVIFWQSVYQCLFLKSSIFAQFKTCLKKIEKSKFTKTSKYSGNFVQVKLQYQEPKSTRLHASFNTHERASLFSPNTSQPSKTHKMAMQYAHPVNNLLLFDFLLLTETFLFQ